HERTLALRPDRLVDMVERLREPERLELDGLREKRTERVPCAERVHALEARGRVREVAVEARLRDRTLRDEECAHHDIRPAPKPPVPIANAHGHVDVHVSWSNRPTLEQVGRMHGDALLGEDAPRVRVRLENAVAAVRRAAAVEDAVALEV